MSHKLYLPRKHL